MKARGIQTSILRTNRQIHAEAANVLYGENRFFFPLGIMTDYRRCWWANNWVAGYFKYHDNVMSLTLYGFGDGFCFGCSPTAMDTIETERSLYEEAHERTNYFVPTFKDSNSLREVRIVFDLCFREHYGIARVSDTGNIYSSHLGLFQSSWSCGSLWVNTCLRNHIAVGHVESKFGLFSGGGEMGDAKGKIARQKGTAEL